MQIGRFELDAPVILAPMAGITDAIFRAICREMGAGLTVTEMISSDTSLYASDKTLSRLSFQESDSIRSVQIVGSDPHKLAEAAIFNARLGADIIDINMGCPAKKICRKAAGSALLSDPSLVREILSAVVKAVDIPVTLKIRTGVDHDNRNAVEIAGIAENEGVAALAIHGRTRADKFAGCAEFETIKQVKQSISIPVIANGDIDSGQKALAVLEQTGADAVMIGRAAQGNPWIFRDIINYINHGVAASRPTSDEVKTILLRHMNGLYSIHGEHRGVRIARKHIAWYCKEKSGVASFRQCINKVETATDQLALVNRFFSCKRWESDTCNSQVNAA